MRGKDGVNDSAQAVTGITPACAGKSHSVTDANASSWDHPRVCGEKALQSSVNCTMEGSPPRMRGKAASGGDREPGAGITPAYAGKSTRLLIQQLSLRDHPRVCGEKSEMSLNLSALMGSPPRMRGKDLSAIVSPPYVGITPAYAGKRNSFTKSFEEHGDHPRVCGEKFDLDCTCVTELGSPPRMRGKGPDDRAHPLVPGITPAYAGKRGRDK